MLINFWVFFLISGVALMAFGGYIFLKKHSAFGGGLFFFVGIAMTLTPFWPWLWLIMLVVAGIALNRRYYFNLERGADPLLACGSYWLSDLEVKCFLNKTTAYIRSDDFQGGYIHTYFGSSQIDLSEANIQKSITLNIEVVFGKVELILPSYMSLMNELNYFMMESTVIKSVVNGQQLKVHLRGSIIGGNIRIVFK